MKLSLLSIVSAGMFLLMTTGVLMVKVMGLHPIYFLGTVFFAATAFWVFIICRMVSTGRVKAKGAKKRRAQVVPYI